MMEPLKVVYPETDLKLLMDVYYYGTYYNPAGRHYGPGKSVVCDKCKRTNLPVCIGYGQTDLCMSCVETIARSMSPVIFQPVPPPNPVPLHNPFPVVQPPVIPEISKYGPAIAMMGTSEFKRFPTTCTSEFCVTDMETSIFKKKDNSSFPDSKFDKEFFDQMKKDNKKI